MALDIRIAGDTKYYRVGLVSEENVTEKLQLIRLTEDIITSKAKADSLSSDVTTLLNHSFNKRFLKYWYWRFYYYKLSKMTTTQSI